MQELYGIWKWVYNFNSKINQMRREMHVPMQFYANPPTPILIRMILLFQGDKSNNIYALFVISFMLNF